MPLKLTVRSMKKPPYSPWDHHSTQKRSRAHALSLQGLSRIVHAHYAAPAVLFNTLAYAVFFGVVFVVAWLLVRYTRLRLWFLLLASYYFYAQWDPRFLLLIFASSSVDWLLGNAIAAAPSDRRRKQWLALTIAMNLGVLGLFKYFDFGVAQMSALLQSFGFHPPEIALRLTLPVGISFFTFESMSYVIDVYRRQIPPHKSYVEYLTFVAFFPHLVAGPIIRPRDLLPQLSAPARFDAPLASRALLLIGLGLFKKVAIGDYLALNLVDRVFDAPLQYSALECYVALVAYAVQIYCDFSGYTDIAIGSAALLGIGFPPNFNSPYKAHNIIDFWRRWHISLSTWLRDYLYIPLGGNRHGPARTYFNLFVTMLLGGLWHGANLTFVVWGGLHGMLLVVTRAFHELRGARAEPRSSGPGRVLAVLSTFHAVCLCWLLFRAKSLDDALLMLGRLASFSTFHPNLDARVLGVLAIGLISHYCPERWYERALGGFARMPAPLQAAVLLVLSLSVREMASLEAVPFVYFQF
ncbi:MAG TPA: MBOAT family protein [Polyangiaceae bacterium]|nr:MBOAT family protein [Polyangiaceae bacterium]